MLHLSPSKNIIAKMENISTIGETVVDENLKAVGKIVDIIGPVSSPYAVIKPTIGEPEQLSKKMLYVIPSKKRRREN